LQNEYYRDFYEKALIPAGTSDKKTFLDIQPDFLHTHMMIGLQGLQTDGKDYYNWHVIIYKSDSNGIYDVCTPIYSSTTYDKFNDAVEAARKIEKEIRNDQLHTVCLQEKIS
jgi:hypothetical protein